MRGKQEGLKGSLVLHLKRKEGDWAIRWSDGIHGGVAWAYGRQVREGMGAGREGDKRENEYYGCDSIYVTQQHLMRYDFRGSSDTTRGRRR